MEKMGEKIEKSVKNSGVESFEKEFLSKYGKRRIEPKKKVHVEQTADKERIKKRIQGLIKLQKSIPIEKLSQTLSISKEEAENIVYELAAEGIEGELEEGVFKFTSNSEEVIQKLFEMIDNM